MTIPPRLRPPQAGGPLLATLLCLGLAGPAATVLLPPPAARAATDAPLPLEAVRALNTARTAAVKLNGGLSLYRPAACMFRTSARPNPCLIRSDRDGFVYRFAGGPPGWESEGLAPSLETEIWISPDGREVRQVLHNGAPR